MDTLFRVSRVGSGLAGEPIARGRYLARFGALEVLRFDGAVRVSRRYLK